MDNEMVPLPIMEYMENLLWLWGKNVIGGVSLPIQLEILEEQRKDLSTAIDQLLLDIRQGKKHLKVYKQMKLYRP